MLRKVAMTDQSSTRMKVDGRDMLIEQIRNKVSLLQDGYKSILRKLLEFLQSFMLKPAVVKKPIIVGPPTNLNIASILENAHTICLALGGSDDDNGDGVILMNEPSYEYLLQQFKCGIISSFFTNISW